MDQNVTENNQDILPPLFKMAVGGKVVIWRITVEPVGIEADIIVSYGFADGKQQQQRERISKGKNIGRANATTPLQQALLEAKARWTKQLERKGYGLTADASKAVRAQSPMLALVYADYAKRVDWGTAFVQGKRDGHRCLASFVDGVVLLRSRENKPILTMPHIAEGLYPLFKKQPGLVLDGELYAHEMQNFNKLASSIKRRQAGSAKILYHVYDQLSPWPFKRRFDELQQVGRFADQDCIELVETVVVDNEDDFGHAHQHFVAEGYEGSMLRHGLNGYEAGKRSQSLLKCKDWLDADFEIVDVKEGRGTHAGMAIFTCVTPAGHDFDVLAPGTHDDKRAAWRDHRAFIGRRLTVKYKEFSKSEEPVPLFPTALRFEGDA